jgi:hypothetical protein
MFSLTPRASARRSTELLWQELRPPALPESIATECDSSAEVLQARDGGGPWRIGMIRVTRSPERSGGGPCTRESMKEECRIMK